jgi:hypothetical protein
MKKITLLITLMITSLGFSQKYLPLTFTNSDQLMTGSGSVTSLVQDPSNSSNQVMQIVGGTDPWDLAKIVLSTSVNLEDDTNNTITFRINPIGVTGVRNHLLKFEGPGYAESFFSTNGSGWQTITANFPSGLQAYYTMVIFTDFNNANSGTYLVDDIMGASNNPLVEGVTVPLTFSSGNHLFRESNVTTSLVQDPDDAANQVMQVVGPSDSWNAAVINLSPGVNLSDDANNTISFRINPIGVSGVRNHLLKFEGAGQVEGFFTTNGPGWQTITIDFGTNLGTYPTVALFPDSAGNGYYNGTDGENYNTGTYLIDDFKFASSLSTSKFDKASLKMYPNPVKNKLNIEANGSIQKVSVYNVLGQEVMSVSPKSNTTSLQTNQLKIGIYIVKIDIDGVIRTSKFLKE